MLQRSALTVSQGITHTIQHVGQGIVRANNKVFTSVARAFRSIGNVITAVVRSIVNAVTAAFRSIIKAITAAFRSIVNAITAAFHGIVNAITAAFRSIVNASTTVLHRIVRAVSNAFRAITSTLARIWRRIGLAILDGVRGIGRFFQRLRTGLGRMVLRLQPTTLTLSMENSLVRAVAFKGRDVVAWTSTSLDDPPSQGEEIGQPGPEEDGEPPAEEISPLKTALKEMVSGRTRLVTDMPMYAPLIRQLHLPKMANRYRQQMILSEVLETIPFGPEEVDVSWRLRQDAEGEEAFAIAVPKGYVDSQVRMVKEARFLSGGSLHQGDSSSIRHRRPRRHRGPSGAGPGGHRFGTR